MGDKPFSVGLSFCLSGSNRLRRTSPSLDASASAEFHDRLWHLPLPSTYVPCGPYAVRIRENLSTGEDCFCIASLLK
jgi:hypothetical protein